MNKEIIYQNNFNKVSVESLYYIGGYVTYEVSVATRGFCGICNFCIKEEILKKYVQIADCMIESLCGELEVKDCESDAYIKFKFENSLSLNMFGQIGGSHEENVLRFKMKVDQTILRGLREKLLDY